ncbi:QRFP-like peptide receptor [Haliotis asinina]|uniref:QRFP-like peptide receptor n=1 Tax=Haliotis asinina TaxID=109174 RepID=UPI00353215C1
MDRGSDTARRRDGCLNVWTAVVFLTAMLFGVVPDEAVTDTNTGNWTTDLATANDTDANVMVMATGDDVTDNVTPDGQTTDSMISDEDTNKTLWVTNVTGIDIKGADYAVTSTAASSAKTSATNDTENDTDNDVSDALCGILDEFPSPNFWYKYTREQATEALCKCAGICVAASTQSPEEVRAKMWEKSNVLSDRNWPRFLAVTIVFSTIFIIGFVGNALTISCLTCWLKVKSSTFLFILSLACSDILLLTVCLPMKALELFYLNDLLRGPACVLTYFIRDFSLACSVLTLTIISFERFYAICYPLKAQFRCSTTRARILIVITWVLSGVLCTPTVLIMKSYYNSLTYTNICIAVTVNYLWVQLYYIYMLILLYLAPLGVMCYTYTGSCLALYRSAVSARNMQGDGRTKSEVTTTDSVSSSKGTSPEPSSGGTDKAKGSDKSAEEKSEGSIQARIKVMQMLVAMLVVFVVCWGPMLFYQVLKEFDIKPKKDEDIYRLTVQTLAFFNSSLNPYFYMAMSSQFRHQFRKRFGRCLGLKAPPGGDTTVATSSTMSSRYQSSVYSTTASGKSRI